jgi:membrane associated rhomboid family serine protease
MDTIFPRRLRRWSMMRLAAATVGVAWIVLLAAFVYSAISVPPRVAGLVAAAAALVIAAAGFLYAWREPGR